MVDYLNKKLISIYKSLMEKYAGIPPETKVFVNEKGETYSIIGKDMLSFPYLLQVTDNFQKYKKHVVIFGQEPNSWGDKEFRFWGDYKSFSNLPEVAKNNLNLFPTILGGSNEVECIECLIRCLMSLYNWKNFEDFKDCDGNNYENFYRFLKEHCTNQGFSVIRNNLAKISYKYGKKGNDPQLNLQFLGFINQELELLKPDSLIFLTGPQEKYVNLMNVLLSSFEKQYTIDYLFANKPNKTNPVRILNPIPIKGKRVKILWSYHPGCEQNKYLREAKVLQKMKDEYIRIIK